MTKMFEKPHIVAAVSVLFALASWLNWTAAPAIPNGSVPAITAEPMQIELGK